MATWRRKAIVALPHLRRDLNRPNYTIYQFFFDLLPIVREAQASRDEETLRRGYKFASWFFRQTDRELRNAAGVAFYEHLFDGNAREWPEIAGLIPSDIRQGCWTLWERRLPPGKVKELAKLFRHAAELTSLTTESPAD